MEELKTFASRVVGRANADLDSHTRLDLGPDLRIERVLAERPGALTYLAHEADLKRPVILRVRDRQPLEAAGLLDSLEASMAEVAAIKHQTIVPIYDFGVSDHTVWWTSQFVQSQSLDDLVRSEGRLSLDRTIRIAARVADALHHAHDRGVAHGEVSPANLLVRNADWVVIKNFVRPEAWLPTVARIEAAKRSPDGDQRALALTIYRSLIGDVDRPSAGLMTELASTATLATRHPDLSPSVAAALVRGADPDPAKQFPSVVALVDGLLSIPVAPNPAQKSAAVPAVVVPEAEAWPDIMEEVERKRTWIKAAVGAVVVIAGLGLVRWVGSIRDRVAPPPAVAKDIPVLPGRNPAAGAIRPAAPSPTPADSIATLPPPQPSAVAAAPPPAPAPEPVLRSVPAPAPPPPLPASAEPEPVIEAVPPVRGERTVERAPASVVGGSRLSVSSVPRGTLYVDNRLIGPTPRSRLQLPTGRHVIRIVRPGYRTYLSMIELGPGEERRLTNLVLERRR